MTDTERLEWACGVFNRERWLGREWSVHTIPPPKAQQFQVIAIALALDERARRRLPEREQAEWAAAELSRRNHAGCVAWKRVGTCVDATDLEDYCVSTAVCALVAADAIAIAESLVRREMLGDTSDASPKEVKS